MQNLLFKIANRNRRSCLSAFFLFLTVAMSGQTVDVTGLIVDANGEPLMGSTVSQVGKPNVKAMADMDGKFTIQVPQNAIISVSFVGCETKTVRIKPGMKLPITIQLKDDSKALGEVVVTALGITREQKSLGYARQSIDTESLEDTRDPNLLNSLTGKVAGVNFISNGGPMSSTRVEIRGNNSITGNNQPLYVIDGVPILNDMGESGDLDYGNAASFISPDDIESIEVLKGANASALYGSDAANGVILITTKQASKKKGLGVTYGFNAQFSYLREFPIYQNVYGTMARQGIQTGYNYFGSATNNGYSYNGDLPYGAYLINKGNLGLLNWGLPMMGGTVYGRNDLVCEYTPNADAITNMYETGIQMTHNVAIDKVFDKGSVRVSYTGIKYDGMLKNFNNMTRHNFTVTSNTNLAKWLSLNVNVNYQLEGVDNRDYKGTSSRNPMYCIMFLPRDVSLSELLPYKQPNGQPYNIGSEFNNPYWLLNECSNGDGRNSFRGTATLNIKPFQGLTVRLRGSMESTHKNGWKFDNYYSPWDKNGYYMEFEERSSNYNYEAVAIYDTRLKKFLKDLSINATLGTSMYKQEWNKITNEVNELAVPDVKALSNNASILKGSKGHSGKEKQAVFGALSLGYKGAYFDFTARNDWSSTLPQGNNSYFYTAESFSAVLTELIPQLRNNVLSFLKLRGSIAKVGNDTGFDQLIDGYSYGNLFRNTYAWYTGDNVKKNNNLKPETTVSKECGIEFRLWGDRIKGDITYYDKRTRDQIVRTSVSYGSGYQSYIINSGEISNKGWEIALTAVPLRFKDFEWKTTINWSKNNSMVESLPEGIDKIQLAEGMWCKSFAEVGRSFGSLYAYVYRRNDKGQILCDANGIPLKSSDMEFIGNIQADWRGGWQNTFRYKNFGFSISIDFQKGGLLNSWSASRGAINGATVQTLEGRYEDYFSNYVLGESNAERRGFLDPTYANTPTTNGQLYADWARKKGLQVENAVYSDDVPGLAGQNVYGWVNPRNWWCDYSSNDVRRFIYDASFIKLREITVSYDCPKKWFNKTPLTGVRLAAVGRNIATLFSNTPIGLDPQATSSTGNAQGFERGFNLPEASYGFDIKLTF